MKYALVFYETVEQSSQRESAAAPEYWGAWSAYIDLLADENVLVRGAGAGLQTPDTATSVRLTNGAMTIQDGPIADVKEQLGGLVVIDVPDLDTAIAYAGKAPCANGGGVEVRPVLPDPS